MIDNIYIDAEARMRKCIEFFKNYIGEIRTGRASPSVLNRIKVEYYGKLTPLLQLANVVVEDSRTLAITVFDHTIISEVEKAIMASDLGLNPCSSGIIIRIVFASLTAERRCDLIKIIRNEAEKSKISIRNARKFANNQIKFLIKDKLINEDEEHRRQDEIQILTNLWIKKLDSVLIKKEQELMEF